MLAAGITAAAFGGTATGASASLGPATNFQLNGSQPSAIVSADFTGDGKLDLATADAGSDEISVLPGDGTGNFGLSIETSTNTTPRSLATGDLNGDDKADLFVGNYGSTSAQVFLGNGNGTFQSPIGENTGSFVTGVALGELLGDSNPDLAWVNYSTNKVLVGAGTGVGGIGVPKDYAVESQPLAMGFGDFNGDGRNDIAVANSGGDSVSVLLSTGGGTGFAAAVRYETSTGAGKGLGPNSLAIGDINGDGKQDVITANTYSGDVSVLVGAGNGTFAAPRNFMAGDTPTGVATGKLSDDPNADIVTAIPSTNMASILPGDGGGNFGLANGVIAAGSPKAVWTGDLNGDGNTDLAVTNTVSDSVSVLLNQAPVIGISPTSIDFGPKVVGAAGGKSSVTITNSAGDPLSVAGATFTGPDATDFKVGSDGCSTTSVPSAGSCAIDVLFNPGSAGAKSASLKLDYNGAGSPALVPLQGTAITAGIACRVKLKKKRGKLKSARAICKVKPAVASAGKSWAWKLKKGRKTIRKGTAKTANGRVVFKIPASGKLKKGRYRLVVGGAGGTTKTIRIRG